MNNAGDRKVVLLLFFVGICLFEFVLERQSSMFREYAAVFASLHWMLLTWLAVWCGAFLFWTFRLEDLPLVGLLVIAAVLYFMGSADFPQEMDAVIFFAGVTIGKGAKLLLQTERIKSFLLGLIGLLLFSSCWHLDMSDNSYHGPRWMGLWSNPNLYGMLMGVGVVLAAGLLAANQSPESRKQKWKMVFLGLAVFILGVGLVMSYSRGAWLATAVALTYLAWCYGKLKWRYVAIGAVCVAAVVLFHWGNTPDHAPWYVKRADLGRPSAQNRATAWRAGLEIMRDYPLGVGWNNTVKIYGDSYHPPEGGPAAIMTNDYFMLGTQLGIPGLLCFVSYVALQLGVGRRKPEGKANNAEIGNQIACRAGALMLVVVFWFDGRLFSLAVAPVFWVLLELGAYRAQKVDSGELTVKSTKPA